MSDVAMQCSEFQQRLRTAIEVRTNVDTAELRAHLESCPSGECRSLWQEHRLLTTAITAWKTGRPATGLDRRRLDQVWADVATQSLSDAPPAAATTARPVVSPLIPTAGSRGSQGGRTGRWLTATLSSAAVLALVLFVSTGREQPAVQPGGGLAQSGAADQRPGADANVTPGHPDAVTTPEVVADAADPSGEAVEDLAASRTAAAYGRPYVELAQKTTGFATDLALLVVPEADAASADSAESTLPWVDRLGERLSPVSTGVQGKLHEWFGGPAT